MDGGVAHLGSIIAAHLREWAFVELSIFESDDARVIASVRGRLRLFMRLFGALQPRPRQGRARRGRHVCASRVDGAGGLLAM
jgi:hypothetical protein